MPYPVIRSAELAMLHPIELIVKRIRRDEKSSQTFYACALRSHYPGRDIS